MKRRLFEQIRKADREENKRITALFGMKGTGKTVSVLDYVKKSYDEYLYIDLPHDLQLKEYINNNKDKGLREIIALYYKIDEEYLINIPVVLDEPFIELFSEKIFVDYDNSLKLFIISSDKSIKNLLIENAGKYSNDICFLDVNPLNFGDFLIALEKEWYEEIIIGHLMRRRRIPEMIHQELLDLYDLYVQIGGFPEIVNEYLKLGNLENIRERQIFLKNSLWFHYSENKDNSNASGITGTKVLGILNAVEKILCKENHKFMFSAIRDGVTRKNYEDSLDFLCAQSALLKLKKYPAETDGDFRLYYSDISLYEKQEASIIYESIIIQNILSSGIDVYYWESGKGASLDCVAMIHGNAIPIDIRYKGKGSLRSIRSFLGDKDESIMIRLSEENCKFDGNHFTLPVYTAYAVERLFST